MYRTLRIHSSLTVVLCIATSSAVTAVPQAAGPHAPDAPVRKVADCVRSSFLGVSYPTGYNPKSVAAADVYVGDARDWSKPAEVDADQIYAKIDEYKEILEKGLKPGDAKYDLLMCKASKRFTCAVKKAAKDGSYDLVAKVGAVKGVDSVPDVTSDVIAKL